MINLHIYNKKLHILNIEYIVINTVNSLQMHPFGIIMKIQKNIYLKKVCI
jgi:hypothetical protein